MKNESLCRTSTTLSLPPRRIYLPGVKNGDEMLRRLAIRMNGIRVRFGDRTKGEDRLQYLSEWIADEQGRPLSLSLPFTPGNQPWRGNIVRDYFDNLLPDSDKIHRRLAMRYRVESLEPFDLLSEAGRDFTTIIF